MPWAKNPVEVFPVLQRLFTVDEANRALVRIRPILVELVGLRRRLDSLIRELHRIHREVHSEGTHPGPDLRQRLETGLTGLSALDTRMKQLASKIQAEGAVLKDLKRGIVDFPAVIERQPVYLCYLLGEDEVSWWHGVEEGFQGRRPLPTRQNREETGLS